MAESSAVVAHNEPAAERDAMEVELAPTDTTLAKSDPMGAPEGAENVEKREVIEEAVQTVHVPVVEDVMEVDTPATQREAPATALEVGTPAVVQDEANQRAGGDVEMKEAEMEKQGENAVEKELDEPKLHDAFEPAEETAEPTGKIEPKEGDNGGETETKEVNDGGEVGVTEIGEKEAKEAGRAPAEDAQSNGDATSLKRSTRRSVGPIPAPWRSHEPAKETPPEVVPDEESGPTEPAPPPKKKRGRKPGYRKNPQDLILGKFQPGQLLQGDDWQSYLDRVICNGCQGVEDDERIILCDGCDAGYHFYCLTPKLTDVPSGEWFCPVCTKYIQEGGTILRAGVPVTQSAPSSTKKTLKRKREAEVQDGRKKRRTSEPGTRRTREKPEKPAKIPRRRGRPAKPKEPVVVAADVPEIKEKPRKKSRREESSSSSSSDDDLFPPDWNFSKTKPKLRRGTQLQAADVYQWYTPMELKTFLNRHGLSHKGRLHELVKRVVDYCAEAPPNRNAPGKAEEESEDTPTEEAESDEDGELATAKLVERNRRPRKPKEPYEAPMPEPKKRAPRPPGAPRAPRAPRTPKAAPPDPAPVEGGEAVVLDALLMPVESTPQPELEMSLIDGLGDASVDPKDGGWQLKAPRSSRGRPSKKRKIALQDEFVVDDDFVEGRDDKRDGDHKEVPMIITGTRPMHLPEDPRSDSEATDEVSPEEEMLERQRSKHMKTVAKEQRRKHREKLRAIRLAEAKKEARRLERIAQGLPPDEESSHRSRPTSHRSRSTYHFYGGIRSMSDGGEHSNDSHASDAYSTGYGYSQHQQMAMQMQQWQMQMMHQGSGYSGGSDGFGSLTPGPSFTPAHVDGLDDFGGGLMDLVGDDEEESEERRREMRKLKWQRREKKRRRREMEEERRRQELRSRAAADRAGANNPRMAELERKRLELLQKKRQKMLELKDLLEKREKVAAGVEAGEYAEKNDVEDAQGTMNLIGMDGGEEGAQQSEANEIAFPSADVEMTDAKGAQEGDVGERPTVGGKTPRPSGGGAKTPRSPGEGAPSVSKAIKSGAGDGIGAFPEEFVVTAILDQRQNESLNRLEFYTSWADGDYTWEPKESFIDDEGVYTDLFLEYIRKRRQQREEEAERRSAHLRGKLINSSSDSSADSDEADTAFGQGNHQREPNVCCHYCRSSRIRKKNLRFLACNTCPNVFCANCCNEHLHIDIDAASASSTWQCNVCTESCCCCNSDVCPRQHQHCHAYRRAQQRKLAAHLSQQTLPAQSNGEQIDQGGEMVTEQDASLEPAATDALRDALSSEVASQPSEFPSLLDI